MTPAQEKRLVAAHESIAHSFGRLAIMAELWLSKQYPEPEQVDDKEIEIYRVGDAPVNQPESPEEYHEFPEDGPGRFETLIKAAKAG